MADIFISYAHADQLEARRLAGALEQEGWSVWWDRRLAPGEIFDEVIEEQLAAARCVIVLWSSGSIRSRSVKAEASWAREHRLLVPAAIEDVTVPLFYRPFQTASLISWEGDRSHLGFIELVEGVDHILGRKHQPCSEKHRDANPGTDEACDNKNGADYAAQSVDPLTEPQGNVRVGDVIKDRFVVVEELGSGGMGKVFKAEDKVAVEAMARQSFVAIKVLHQSFKDVPIAFHVLQREVEKTRSIAHPNIIRVYDMDRVNDIVFMIMEYLDGRSASELLDEPGFSGLSIDDTMAIVEPVCTGLAYAHQCGLIHSDLKPSNIFVTKGGITKIIDFGIARARSDSQKETTIFDVTELGALTPAYASPERMWGNKPDPRDDIFSLACITYELLTGTHPFRRLASKTAHADVELARPSQLTTRQWRGLQNALSLARKDRTESVERFRADMKRSQSFFVRFAAAWRATR